MNSLHIPAPRDRYRVYVALLLYSLCSSVFVGFFVLWLVQIWTIPRDDGPTQPPAEQQTLP
jgi:hypothetical protein